jgi:branched-chain amino acid transport system ATP-binding protein
MTESYLRVERLCAGYGDVQVLWDANIDVRRGEIVCIVGSNGAGKSTLLKCISGLVGSISGRVLLEDVDLTNAEPDRVLATGIAQVPEGRRLFSAMSVRNNLLMGAYLRRDGQAAIMRDLEHVYQLFPVLKERKGQTAGTLSGGEQQMCAIARGIMSKPMVLMIDELSLGLAPLIVGHLSEALVNINRSGISILLVEQDVMIAFELANRGYVLESGRVILQGDTEDLSDDPMVREAYMGI